MKPICDCVMPEYNCAECPNKSQQGYVMLAQKPGETKCHSMCGVGYDFTGEQRLRELWQSMGLVVTVLTTEDAWREIEKVYPQLSPAP